VAVAAGNDRIWRDIADCEIVACPVSTLPEVVRASADAGGLDAVHVGTVRSDDEVVCVALWFAHGGDADSLGDHTDRRAALRFLASAVAHEQTAGTASDAGPGAVGAGGESTSDDDPSHDRIATELLANTVLDDPDFDPVTGLASRDRFERELDEFESDEATLVVIDIDDHDALLVDFGTATVDRVLQEVAARLASACRRSDVVARLDAGRFGVVLAAADRSTALGVSKRLLGVIAEPLASADGPPLVTASIGVAHEFGLPDMEELFESATHAAECSRRAGTGRLMVAS
jgi:diguanylate cyclase (GGDEF)-like protein